MASKLSPASMLKTRLYTLRQSLSIFSTSRLVFLDEYSPTQIQVNRKKNTIRTDVYLRLYMIQHIVRTHNR